MEGISLSGLVGAIIRLFLLLSPFCTLSLYLGYSDNLDGAEQRKFGIRISTAIWVICLVFYFFGRIIFDFLGITLDAFRIGAGIMLFFTGFDLVRGSGIPKARACDAEAGDIAVVPMALPYTVGPGSIAALLLMGKDAVSIADTVRDIVTISIVGFMIGLLLYKGRKLEKILKRKGLSVLGKLTGLFLVALASQIIMTGVRNLINLQ